MKPWTREDDRLIAEKCEGWYMSRPDGDYGPWAAYNTDLVAAMRATHTWSRQEPDHRGFDVGRHSCHDAGPEARLWDDTSGNRVRYWSQGDSYADALARALLKAVSENRGT